MPDKQQDDFVTQFRALPRDRQTALIGKMTPEQKQKLSTAIKATPAKAPGAKGTSAAADIGKTAVGVLSGIGGGVMQGVQTGINLANKALPQGAQIPSLPSGMTEQRTTAEKVGGGIETAMEYSAGEGALKALTSALKIKDVATVAKLVKQFPWLSKVGIAGMKAFVLGTGQSALHGEEHPLRAGVETGASGGIGEGIAGTLEKRGAKAVPKMYEAVNEHIGLKQSDLPKWERMSAEDAHSVGKTVVEQGALRNSLEDTHAAIEVSRERIQGQTEAIITAAKGRGVPIHSDLQNINAKVAKHFLDMGKDISGTTTNAANSIYNEFKGITNPQMTVKEAFDLRKKIGTQIDWNNLKNTENVRQMFLGELYHALNNDIEKALPPDQARKFAQLNRIHNRLIIAREASGSKIVQEGMKEAKKGGIASKAATVAAHAAGGALVGAVAGAPEGHSKEEAGIGAIIGGAVGAKKEIRIPRMDVRAEKIIAKTAPRLAAAARKSPALARAIESATAAHGGGSGSVSAP